MSAPRRVNENDTFCEHHRHPCLFCGKIIRIGHQTDEEHDDSVIFHEDPLCEAFTLCDNMDQFTMLSKLKLKSDLGQLEKN